MNRIIILNPQQVDALLAKKSPHTFPDNGLSQNIIMYSDPTTGSTQLVVKNYSKSGLSILTHEAIVLQKLSVEIIGLPFQQLVGVCVQTR